MAARGPAGDRAARSARSRLHGLGTLALLAFAAGCAPLPTPEDGRDAGSAGADHGYLREDGRTSVPLRAESLLGLDGAELVQTLGKPNAFRREQPAEIWQYSNDGCVLDVVLYQDGGPARVVYLEARSREADALPVERCLARLGRPAARTS